MEKEADKQEKFIRAVKCSIIYMIIYCLLVLLAIYFAPDEVLALVGILGGVYIIINAFFIKYKRERLFVNGLLSALPVSGMFQTNCGHILWHL